MKEIIIDRYADHYGIPLDELKGLLDRMGAVRDYNYAKTDYLQLIKETYLKNEIGKTIYKDLFPTVDPDIHIRRKTILKNHDFDDESYELFKVSTGKKVDRLFEKVADWATLSLSESSRFGVGFYHHRNGVILSGLKNSSCYQVKICSVKEEENILVFVNRYGRILNLFPEQHWRYSIYNTYFQGSILDGPNKRGELFLLGHLYDNEGKDIYRTNNDFILRYDGDNIEDCGDYLKMVRIWGDDVDTFKIDLSIAKYKKGDFKLIHPDFFQLFDSLYDKDGNRLVDARQESIDPFYNTSDSDLYSYIFSVDTKRQAIIAELRYQNKEGRSWQPGRFFIYDLDGVFHYGYELYEEKEALRIAWNRNKWGLVDSNDKMSSPFIYDSISRIETSSDFYSLVKNAPCEKIVGWYIVRIGPSFGLLNESGRFMVPTKQYKQLIIAPEGIRAIHNDLPLGDPYCQLFFFDQSCNTSGEYDLYDYFGNLINESK